MSGIPDKKQSITAALTQRRIQLQNEGSLLKPKVRYGTTHLESINVSWKWACRPATFGWLLSRIPARKKRIYIHSSSEKPIKRRDNGPLGQL